MINSIKYVKNLEAVGFSREQAEIHLQIVSEVMESTLATKQDLAVLSRDLVDNRTALSQDIVNVRTELKHEISLIEQKIFQSEQRMIIKLGTIVSIAIGVAVGLVKMIG